MERDSDTIGNGACGGEPSPVRLVTSRSGFDEIAGEIGRSRSVALKVESHGNGDEGSGDPWHGEAGSLVLAVDGQAPWLVDLDKTGCDTGILGAAIGASLVIAHGAGTDLLWLAVKCGIRPKNVFCTRTASWLLTAGTHDGNSLEEVMDRHLGPRSSAAKPGADLGGLFLAGDLMSRARREVVHLHELRKMLSKNISKAGLKKVADLEMALIPVVVAMEEAGIAADAVRLRELRGEALKEMGAAARMLADLLKTPSLNPASPQRLQSALARAGIDVPDTEEATLLESNDGTIIPAVLAFRRADNIARQAESLLKSIRSDGRIHARFDAAGTDTGRFSCRSPNLQSVGRGPLRSCFVAAPGCCFVVADYSQIELRAVASIAGEPAMKAAFEAGDDLHSLTAAAILDKPPGEIGKEDRQVAKSANFGLIYGQGANGLVKYAARAFGVSLGVVEASRVINKFFACYPGIARWHAACWKAARNKAPEARSAIGRRRLILQNADGWSRFTTLVNAPVQGSCADGMKRAMVELARLLPSGARIVSTIHDEIIVECPADAAPEVARITRETLIEAMSSVVFGVRIDVGIAVGPDWGAAK